MIVTSMLYGDKLHISIHEVPHDCKVETTEKEEYSEGRFTSEVKIGEFTVELFYQSAI